EQTDEEKPRFAKLKANQSIETITLAEAMELFELPRTLGIYEGQEVQVNVGRYGPYIKLGDNFISIPKTEDLHSLELEKAIEYIKEKEQVDAPIAVYEGMPVTKGKGRFGPFIKWNSLFINVPRAYNFDALSQKDVNELIEKKLEKESNRFIQQWPEAKISIENGRWGPFIRFGKQMLKLAKKDDGTKYTNDDAATLTLEAVKAMIELELPGAFTKKAATPKKAAVKKAAPKK
ncbi:MAG TPA: DNA topoisomerase I, partial [Chitinophagaceae bacterium]|nr:DNA topoisomerase I [Chitinophagaceae bacterium]